MKDIAIIGCGNIGGSLARALLSPANRKEYRLRVFDPNQDKLRGLDGAVMSDSAQEAVVEADIIILAVKPNLTTETLSLLSIENQCLVSVAAGVTMNILRPSAGPDVRIVRAMPNLAMSLGLGMTALYGESRKDVELAQKVFQAVGECVVLDEEVLIDTATALCGSGPAFFYAMIEALAKAASDFGIDPEQSLRMATQTARGAVELLHLSAESPAELIQRVATPGGTTEAGLKALESERFSEAVSSAITAATTRAGQDLSQHLMVPQNLTKEET